MPTQWCRHSLPPIKNPIYSVYQVRPESGPSTRLCARKRRTRGKASLQGTDSGMQALTVRDPFRGAGANKAVT